MANTHTTLSGLFSAIANAIRAKTGGTGAIVADNFPAEIESISTGGITADSPFISNVVTSSSTTVSSPSITIDAAKRYFITTAHYYTYSGGCAFVSNWIYENGKVTAVCGSKGVYESVGYNTVGFRTYTSESGYGTLTVSGSKLTYKCSESAYGMSANGATIIAVEM